MGDLLAVNRETFDVGFLVLLLKPVEESNHHDLIFAITDDGLDALLAFFCILYFTTNEIKEQGTVILVD